MKPLPQCCISPPARQFPEQLAHGDRRRCAMGFTLAEVVVALGITAFSLVGMLALVQSGYTTYIAAMDSTISGSILQQVVNQYQLADFNELVKRAESEETATETVTYDERGLPLEPGSTSSPIYQSRGELRIGTPLHPSSPNALSVMITVTREQSPTFRRTFSLVIARQDRIQ